MENKNIANSIVKAIFGAVPYIGTGLIEAFEYRSKIKQERINHFVNELKEYFETVDPNKLDLNNLKKEEFGDIFESILKRVALNRSNDKLIRFKKVLINEIINPNKNDFSENYLDLVENLNEAQIQILTNHRKLYFEKYSEFHFNKNFLLDEIEDLENRLIKEKEKNAKGYASNIKKTEELIQVSRTELEKVESTLICLDKLRNPFTYNLDKGEYMFFVQDLYSKALLVDNGIAKQGTAPFEYLTITNFGLRFLEFIEK